MKITVNIPDELHDRVIKLKLNLDELVKYGIKYHVEMCELYLKAFGRKTNDS